MKTLEDLDLAIANLDRQIEGIHDQIAPLHKQLAKLSEQKSALVDERGALWIQTVQPDDPQLLLTNQPHQEGTTRYRARNAALRQMGLSGGGYWTNTGQSIIGIALYHYDDDVTAQTYEHLVKLLPHVKPDKEGLRRFEILEHTLSRFCSWTFASKGATPDAECVLLRNGDEDKVFPDLSTILRYIQHHHYYEKRK